MTWHYANGLEAMRDPSAKDLRQKPRRKCLKSVKEVGADYEVRVLDEPIPTVEKIADVGVDYLVIKNEAGIETRIPVTSIKAVIRLSTR